MLCDSLLFNIGIKEAEPCAHLAKQLQCAAPEKHEPAESLRDQRQSDGKRRPDAQPSPSPSPQQPRPMTSRAVTATQGACPQSVLPLWQWHGALHEPRPQPGGALAR